MSDSKRLLFIAAAIATLFSFTSCRQSSSKSADKMNERPNIIFFIADDMSPHHFNCLPGGKGKNLTPNLDRLAEEGVLMLNQTVVSPVCTPSRFNCLTGRFASRATNMQFLEKTKHEEGMTCIQWNSFITSNDKILPQYLKEAGYRTGFAGKNHAIEASGFKKIPDYFANPEDPDIKELVQHNYRVAQEAVASMGFDFAGAVYHNNPDWLGLKALGVQNMNWIAEAGIEFIRQQDEVPFFLYFATTLPHAPTDRGRSWMADPRMTAEGILDRVPEGLPDRLSLEERVKEAGLEGTGREIILWLDDALGALMNELEAKGELDNTIIFFFTDHGQNAKGTLYQGGVSSPSIIWKAGGFPVGSTCKVPVSNVDFAPTILEMAGVEVNDDQFDGRSFKAALEGKEMEETGTLYHELGYARAVRKGKYKYIAVRYPSYATNWTPEERKQVLNRYNDNRRSMDMEIVNEDPTLPFSHLEVIPGGGVAEHFSYGKLPGYFDPDQLYDLEADPGELVNLAGNPEYQTVLDDMKNELQKYIEKLPGTFKIDDV